MDQETKNLSESPEGFGRAVNEYYNHFVTVADAKAGALLAANLVVLGGLMSINIGTIPWLLNVAALFSLISLVLSLFVLYPRIPKKGKGLIFWEHVKDFDSPEEYRAAVNELDKKQLEEDYAFQNWRVSRVLAKKNRFVRSSIWVLMVSISLIAVMLITQSL